MDHPLRYNSTVALEINGPICKCVLLRSEYLPCLSSIISLHNQVIMDLIHYSISPLILFCVLYTLDLLPYNLSIANGAGGVGIFELLIFHCLYRSYRVNNKVIDVLYILMYYYTGILFVVLHEG